MLVCKTNLHLKVGRLELGAKLRGAFNKFPDFFVQAFIIAVNSRYFSMLLLYSL